MLLSCGKAKTYPRNKSEFSITMAEKMENFTSVQRYKQKNKVSYIPIPEEEANLVEAKTQYNHLNLDHLE